MTSKIFQPYMLCRLKCIALLRLRTNHFETKSKSKSKFNQTQRTPLPSTPTLKHLSLPRIFLNVVEHMEKKARKF
ncbi:unnamed protein product, partial [Amoebophrya sp. A25]|eukprot:GSA25T00006918001.1